jgi:hypothetical protein
MMRMMESPLEDAGDISESGAVLAGERFDGVDHGVERRRSRICYGNGGMGRRMSWR